MPTFSRSAYGNERKTIHLKLQTPAGEMYETVILVDEKIKDLAKDFYEFVGIEGDINRVKAYLADPVTKAIIAPLSMDKSLEGQGQRIAENSVILFVTDDSGFSITFTPEKTLQVLMPFPGNLAVSQFLNYSNDFLIASDFFYSIFSILLSENVQSIGALQRMLVEDPKRLYEPKITHRILRISNNKPLELVKIHYGSPLSITLDGLWKPLEMVGEVVKGVRWKWDYEEKAAELDLKERHLKIAETQLKIAIDIANLQISDENKSKLLGILVPGVSSLESVIEVSKVESEHNINRRSRNKDTENPPTEKISGPVKNKFSSA